jgi:hypothetical protein
MAGCGCNKKKGTFDKPLVAGRPNGATPVEGTLVISYGSMAAGQKAWITGDGIALWVEKKYIVLTVVEEEAASGLDEISDFLAETPSLPCPDGAPCPS